MLHVNLQIKPVLFKIQPSLVTVNPFIPLPSTHRAPHMSVWKLTRIAFAQNDVGLGVATDRRTNSWTDVLIGEHKNMN
jgi:hypothetical protein